MMINIALSLSIAACLFALVTAVFSVLSYCKVVGMEKSTHQVAWMPVEEPKEPEFDMDGNELKPESDFVKQMRKQHEDFESQYL